MALDPRYRGTGYNNPPPPAPARPAQTPTGNAPAAAGTAVASSGQGGAPLAASGGSTISKYTWALALVQALGGTPTSGILDLIIAWINNEGTSAAWNPLAITVGNGTNFNSVGVKNFSSMQAGVQATADFIVHNGYTGILTAIRTGDPTIALSHIREFEVWAGGNNNPSVAYGQRLISNYQQISGNPAAGQAALAAANGSAAGTGGGTAGTNPSVLNYVQNLHDPVAFGLLGVPEMADILQQAAMAVPPWTDAQLEAKIHASNYYTSHADNVRAFNDLGNSDPAERARGIQQAEADLRDLASSLGLTISDTDLYNLAYSDKMYAWDTSEQRQHLIAFAAFSGGATGGAGSGVIGDSLTQVKQLFSDYGIKLDDATAQSYALQVNQGSSPTSGIENLRPTAIAQAKGMFPALAPLLDQGVTVRQVFSPYQSAAAQLLEKDPSQIDLTDPKFNRALQGDTKQGQMSLQQWQSTLMTDPQYGWDRTANAKSSAVNLTEQLGQAFGVRY